MTLREALERLDEWDGDATVYVAGEPADWSSESEAAVGIEDVQAEIETLPPEAEGKQYFLEVSIAREVLAAEEDHVGARAGAGREGRPGHSLREVRCVATGPANGWAS